MKQYWLFLLCALAITARAQHLLTPFERSGGKQTTTYKECISFYHRLHAIDRQIGIDSFERTDAGLPLHVISYPVGTDNDPQTLTILINNGIHPGEPDGIDACMMLLRDIAEQKVKVPKGIKLVVIPIYNIGGALNRNNSTRVNQVGPETYGFRGNAQNLDLNRDFVKRDALESRTFSYIFHRYQPAIFIDNHVSDGADYQHTMTLVSTQYDKLGGSLGHYFRTKLDPMLYKKMEEAGWPMSPYVNAEETPDKGWAQFYDPPRFSSGYAALFNCIAWVPETHMLKPFDQRVRSTYALMKAIVGVAGQERETILSLRAKDKAAGMNQLYFPLSWAPDSTVTMWPFKGYEAAYKASEVSGQQRLYYDHKKPINISVPIHDHYKPTVSVKAPRAYIVPQAWHNVIDRLAASNRLDMFTLDADTSLEVAAYTIDSFKTSPAPYEGHYKHSAIHATSHKVRMLFHKGDYLIDLTDHPFRRFLIEALEPEGEDSYFAWGFFDAILQRKEGYSDYRWEDVAAEELRKNSKLKAELEREKASNPALAKDASAQLFYVYRHSRWYEAAHMRYPVYRIE
jgi:hypothetical protein